MQARLLFLGLVVMLVLATQLSVAQQSPERAPENAGETLQASDTVLRQFARAYLAAEKMATTSQQDARSASSGAKTAAAGDLAAALEEQGLTIETYNRIAASLNRDDEVRMRVFEIIEQERGS